MGLYCTNCLSNDRVAARGRAGGVLRRIGFAPDD
jgi:hypothetical protein